MDTVSRFILEDEDGLIQARTMNTLVSWFERAITRTIHANYNNSSCVVSYQIRILSLTVYSIYVQVNSCLSFIVQTSKNSD